MLISHKHKFVFVHVPKTAGKSLKLALSPLCEDWEPYLSEKGKLEMENRRNLNLELKYPDHMWVDEALTWFNVDISNYHFLTVFRNPWVRFQSFYNFLKTHENHRFYDFCNKRSVDDFVVACVNENHFETFPQANYIKINGKFPKNHTIVKFESLDIEIKKFAEKVGVKLVPISKVNTTKGLEKPKLTTRTQGIIQYYEHECIDHCSYKYED